MANAVKGEVGFEAGGEQYVLCLNTNALCDLEDRLGRPAAEAFQEMQEGVSFKVLRTIFACGLGVEEREAGDVIDVIGLVAAADLLAKAFERAFPEAAKGSANPRKAKAPAGTG